MLKKIAYSLILLLTVLLVLGIFKIRQFNNLWFQERPNYLTASATHQPIPFEWSESVLNNYVEPHGAMIIPVKVAGLPHKFYWQFDTGSPYTIIYENPITILTTLGLDLEETQKEEGRFIQNLTMELGDVPVNFSMIEILTNYGDSFNPKDTISPIKLGTIGADFMDKKITVIDFKNQFIQLYSKRPKWMLDLPDFKTFDFQGRRFLLPATIKGKQYELFYDSGSSAFGLITSKSRYDNFTDPNREATIGTANSWGTSIDFYHKETDQAIEIGNATLPLTRVSYVDIYADYQQFMNPFTRIGGWLGNKPFTQKIVIFDTQQEEFIVVERLNN